MRARITAGFLGLYGSVSPLPTYYVEDLAQADYQGGPQPKREFLDVFNHRLLSLFYRAFDEVPALGRLPKERAKTRSRGACSAQQASTDSASTRAPFIGSFTCAYAPLLATKSRSARGLEVVLKDIFGSMGVDIEQFVGHWTLLEKPLRNKMGVANHQLGESLTIGRWVYDGTGRFKIKLGPLKYDEYISFLPGGSNRSVLESRRRHTHARRMRRDARATRGNRGRTPLPARIPARLHTRAHHVARRPGRAKLRDRSTAERQTPAHRPGRRRGRRASRSSAVAVLSFFQLRRGAGALPRTPRGLSAPRPGPGQALDVWWKNCAPRSSSNGPVARPGGRLHAGEPSALLSWWAGSSLVLTRPVR